MQPSPANDLQQHRDWLLALAPIPTAGLWADLGCGRGDDARAVAARHPSPELRLVGLDADAARIAAASQQSSADPRLDFRVHKLGATLPFPDEAVDVVYSHNLLECLANHEGFAREVARVLRPGGWAVVAHWDWDSQLFDGQDKALIRRLVAAFADWQQGWMEHADGWMGRRLWGVFNMTGLFAGGIHAHVLVNTTYAAPWYGHARVQDCGALVEHGRVSAADYRRFVAEQETLSEQGRYFYSITGYAFVGQRMTPTTP